jgi:hypothetical protein
MKTAERRNDATTEDPHAMANEEHAADAREYTLTEAARLLNKTEAALRMRIKRGTLRANVRYIDDTGDRYQYMIPEGELERERERGSSTIGNGPFEGFPASRGESRSTAETVREPFSGPDSNVLAAIIERQAQLEKMVEKERDDTRALIRGIERQIELLTTMVSQLLTKPK